MRLWANRFSKNSFLKNASWMVGGSGLQAGVAFASNIVLARYLMPEDFGAFAIIQANINISSAIINLRLGAYVIKLTQEEFNHQYATISTVAIMLSFINTLIGLVLLMIWSMLTSESVLLLVDKFIGPLILLQLSVYERKLNYKGVMFIETSANILSHIASIVLAIAGVGMIVLYIRVLTETCLRLLHLIRINEFKRMPLQTVRPKDIKRIIENVRGFWLDSLLEGVFERLLVLVGGSILTEKQLGYFVQAKRLAITPHQLLQPIAFRVSYNFFSKVKEAKVKLAMLHKILLSEFAVLILVAVVIFIGGNSIISLLFGAQWAGLGIVLKCMLGVVTCLTLFNTYKSYYMAGQSMETFFKLGRIIQFGILLIAIAGVSMISSNTNLLNGLSLSYSFSYMIPVFILIGYSITKHLALTKHGGYSSTISKKNSSTVLKNS